MRVVVLISKCFTMAPKCIVNFEDKIIKYQDKIEKLSALSGFQKNNLMFLLAKNTVKLLQRYKYNLKIYYFSLLKYVECRIKNLRSFMNKTWPYLRNAYLMYSMEHIIYKEWSHIYCEKKVIWKGAKKCLKYIKAFKEDILQLCE